MVTDGLSNPKKVGRKMDKEILERESFIEDCTATIIDLAKRYISDPLITLELFGGTGQIFLKYLSLFCNKTIGWEIKGNLRKDFLTNVNNGCFVVKDTVLSLINDSYENLEHDANIISIDNPLGLYGEQNQYCEHFDFISYLNKIVRRDTIVAINIVRKPYDYYKHKKWKSIREKFYNTESSSLDMNKVIKKYLEVFEMQKLNVIDYKIVCREKKQNLDYFYMLILAVKKNEDSN